MDDESDGGRGPAGRRIYARYSDRLARRLCARLAGGEMPYRICREPGMPAAEPVAKWARQKPAFGKG